MAIAEAKDDHCPFCFMSTYIIYEESDSLNRGPLLCDDDCSQDVKGPSLAD
jgi:hypothetical protein